LPDRRVHRDAEPPHDVEHLDMRADANAAAREVAGAPLEHRHVPPGLAQQQGGEQPAERAADDKCATRHVRSRSRLALRAP